MNRNIDILGNIEPRGDLTVSRLEQMVKSRVQSNFRLDTSGRS